MPLPTDSVAWPPTDERIQSALADWDAWYSSDPMRLEERYGYRSYRNGASPQNQPRQRGLFGWLQRFFWGTPTPRGQLITKLHVPLAGDIARTSSDLLFSEPPGLTFDDQAANQAAIDALIDAGFHAVLLEGGEVASAIGGAYLRVCWDDEVRNRPWIDAVSQDCAVPEFRNGVLTAVTFWTDLERDGDTVWRHLERHEKGVIYHGLYEGTTTVLGKPRPLADRPETADLADLVNADGGIETGADDMLTAAYIPNVRPARGWRRVPGAAGWGQSDLQGIEPLMDALDETYTSWMRDIRFGKSRIIVPQSALESNGPGRGSYWNEDREIYDGLNLMQRPGDTGQIEVVQFKIRFDEHRSTAQELTELAVRQAGYSPASFGMDAEGGALTATEVEARNARSLSTRNRKALYWRPAIKDILAAWLAVSIAKFGVDGLKVDEPNVEFRDGVAESPQELATTAQLLRAAEAASTDTLVRMLHPDWDKDQIADEVIRVQAESGRMVADPTQVGDEPPVPPELGNDYSGEPDGDEGPLVSMQPAGGV